MVQRQQFNTKQQLGKIVVNCLNHIIAAHILSIKTHGLCARLPACRGEMFITLSDRQHN